MKAVSISNGPNGHADPAELLTLLKVGVLCSDAAIRDLRGDLRGRRLADRNRSGPARGRARSRCQGAAPLSPARQNRVSRRTAVFMATTHQAVEPGKQFIAVKGNPTEVLSLCGSRLERGAVSTLAEDDWRSGRERRHGGRRASGPRYGVRRAAWLEVDHQPTLCWLGLVGLADLDSDRTCGS